MAAARRGAKPPRGDFNGPAYRGAEVAGLDEAGRGCLAGPVVAAAVILPASFDLPGLTDSKKLPPARREALAEAVRAQALAWCLGYSWPREIERINILQASLKAMARAVAGLTFAPARLVVDGNQLMPPYYGLRLPQEAVVDGDALVPVISAASVLAKTARDALMRRLDARYPGYGLAGHKGYATAEHRRAVRELGPCRIHRMTFAGVAEFSGAAHAEPQCLPGL